MWSQRYLQLMGDMPNEDEEPTDAQMAALDKRVNQMGQAPYVDMGVWLPFGRRALKNQKLRSFFPVGHTWQEIFRGLRTFFNGKLRGRFFEWLQSAWISAH